MKISDTGKKCDRRMRIKEGVMEEMDAFWHLRVDFTANGRMGAKLDHGGMEVRKCAGVIKSE